MVWDPNLKNDLKRFERIKNNMALRLFLELRDMLVLPIYGTTLALRVCPNKGKV